METINIEHFTVWCENREEALELKQEIFTHHSYYFESENPEPIIIDAGAHIGLSTLYFKKLYPDSHIVAIEPHPANFALLQKNVAANGLRDITLINAALASESKPTHPFFIDTEFGWFSTASFIPGAWNKAQKTKEITVETTTLEKVVSKPIDLLKLDVEGCEKQVLTTTPLHILEKIKKIIVEVHPLEKNSIELLEKFLQSHNFETTTTENANKYTGKNAGLVLIDATRID